MKLDFLEIGTADFDTCIERAKPNEIGISIEPAKVYFDKLPARSGVIRLNCAISKTNGLLDIYYTKPETIVAHGLPFWLRGCNSVIKPHRLALEQLAAKRLDPDEHIVKETVETLNFETLVQRYDIQSINFLKIDTEGHDLIILEGYRDVCDRLPHLYAERILFETNSHTTVEDQDACIEAFVKRGYTVSQRGHDTILSRSHALSPSCVSTVMPCLALKSFENLRTAAQTAIPSVLHMIWVGPEPPPNYFATHVQEWKRLMPHWTIRVWGNDDINETEFTKDALSAIQTATIGAQKADIMRYFILQKLGGVYVDADIVPHRSLNACLSGSNAILCHDLDITWGYIANGFMAAVPAHPVFNKCCDLVLKAELNTPDVHMKTGPRILGLAVESSGLPEGVIALLPSQAFYHNGDCAERFGSHLYAHSWSS